MKADWILYTTENNLFYFVRSFIYKLSEYLQLQQFHKFF